ncbi:MAG TPA: glycosyltransferase [Candidatus Dojkabacteria bacterium]|nr:glycosyltransferase [Candidatus Dojkabacteria bacterium]
MKRVAFIDHSFHKKSLAFEFLKDILKKNYIVDEYWDDSWDNGKKIEPNDVNGKEYDCVFFAQIFPSEEFIEQLECKNVIWMPMYDSEVTGGFVRALRLLKYDVKILSFSLFQHKKYLSFGLDSTYAQFFTKPEKKLKNLKNKEVTVYYWPRSESISWKTVKKLLGKNFNGKVIIHNVPDPKNTFVMPSAEDVKEYNIKFINEWLSKDQVIKERIKADIFIAPRVYEGIGMAFLEAMSGGCAVISPNNPTMNEYIEDNNTGYLYNIHQPRSIDLSNLKKVKASTYKYMVKGYNKWIKKDYRKPLELIEKPYKANANIFTYANIFITLTISKIQKLIRNIM